MEGANNSTRPRDSESMMIELLQSQRRKEEAASLSHSIMLWGSLRAVCAIVFILYVLLEKQKHVGNNGVYFNCSGH